MLLKKESLRPLLDQPDICSDIILKKCWIGQGSIFSLIPEHCFLPCTWSDLEGMEYAVLSYQWRTNWHAILNFIFGPDGVKLDYIWIDVFCLNQLDGNRMKTIRRSDEIYYNAKEYHLMELGSVFRGWILFELSSANESVHPIIHKTTADKMLMCILREEFEETGFEGCAFSKPLDRELVQKKIIDKYGTIANFNKKVLKIIDGIVGNGH